MFLSAGSFNEDLFALGKCWVHLGHLQAVLLAPTGPVDPAEKQAIRLRYVREEVKQLVDLCIKFVTYKQVKATAHCTILARRDHRLWIWNKTFVRALLIHIRSRWSRQAKVV